MPRTCWSARGLEIFFFFKESLIAFILCRIWRWTAAPGRPGGFSSPTRASPCPSRYAYIYMIKSATAAHHFSSPHSISIRLPFPSPTHEHSIKCAAFCGVQPSQTHHCSSHFPISHNHCRCGPLSVTIYTSPFTALADHPMCVGAFGYIGNSCFIPAGVATNTTMHHPAEWLHRSPA